MPYALCQVLFQSEAHAAAAYTVFTSKAASRSMFSRVGIDISTTSVQTYTNVPTDVALDADASLDEYEAPLPQVAEIIGWSGRLGHGDSMVETVWA